MRVIISDKVFENKKCSDVILVGILGFGYEGRHSILTDPALGDEMTPADDTNLSAWLAEQPKALAEEIRFVLRMGVKEGIQESKEKEEIYVTADSTSVWKSNPPRLCLQDAWRLLTKSLHILVENGRNDGKFLETMFKRLLGPSYWKPVRNALQNDWIHIENGGGIGEMKKMVGSLVGDAVGSTRTCVIFDSDAQEPEKPSTASEALREKCEECSLDYHQLQRRAIENYLPRDALKASVELLSEPTKSSRRSVVNTFSRMNRVQRHHFHMKKGFSDEEITDPPSVFDSLDKEDRVCLKNGFGSDVGDLFYEDDFPICSEWLEKDYTKSDKQEFMEIYSIVTAKI